MTRRRVLLLVALLLVALLLVAGLTVVAWKVADWPPPRLILKYGFPPTGGPTGRRATHAIGRRPNGEAGQIGPTWEVEFLELAPGYVHIDRSAGCCNGGGILGRILRPIGTPFDSTPGHARAQCRYWAEFPKAIWISRSPVAYALVAQIEDAMPPEQYSLIRASGLIEEFALDGVPGAFRLAAEREYDFAMASHAIEAEGKELGWRDDTIDGVQAQEVLLLRPPGEYRFVGYHPKECGYRLVWIPPEDE